MAWCQRPDEDSQRRHEEFMHALDSDADLHEGAAKTVEVFEAACAWQDALRAGESAAIYEVRLLAVIDVTRAARGAKGLDFINLFISDPSSSGEAPKRSGCFAPAPKSPVAGGHVQDPGTTQGAEDTPVMSNDKWEALRQQTVQLAFKTGRPVFADSSGALHYTDGAQETINAEIGPSEKRSSWWTRLKQRLFGGR